MQMIPSSTLLGFGPRRHVELAAGPLQLKVLPVKELTLPRPGGVMYRKHAYLPPAAKRLIELLKAAAT